MELGMIETLKLDFVHTAWKGNSFAILSHGNSFFHTETQPALIGAPNFSGLNIYFERRHCFQACGEVYIGRQHSSICRDFNCA